MDRDACDGQGSNHQRVTTEINQRKEQYGNILCNDRWQRYRDTGAKDGSPEQ